MRTWPVSLLIGLLPVGLVGCSTPPAAGPSMERLDACIRAQMDQQRIPGLAVAIIKDGQVVVAKGYGLANIEQDAPVTRQTIFESGSVGKQFTAALVLLLVEDGRLELDAPISRYLPDTPPAWQPITIRHLLTHTSGIPGFPYGQMDLRRDYADDDLLKLAARMPLEFSPGERWSYSNTGYVLLGIIIDRVTGRFYGDLLAERVFRPLGMDTARIISEADIIPHRASGYQLVDGRRKHQDWVAPMTNRTADGSLYWSLDDLIKWDAALSARRLLSPESYRQMWTPARLNNGQPTEYGFGWFIRPSGGRLVIEHNGAWQGFVADITRYGDGQLTIILMANQAGTKLTPIKRELGAMFLPASTTYPAERRAP